MLVVPDQFACVGVDGEGRVDIEAVAIFTAAFWIIGAPIHGRPWERRADANIEKIQLGIIAGWQPNGSSPPLVGGHIVPGLVTSLTRLRDGVEFPKLFSGFKVERSNETADRAGSAATGSHDHFPVHDQR